MHWKPPRLLVPKRASQSRETGSLGLVRAETK